MGSKVDIIQVTRTGEVVLGPGASAADNVAQINAILAAGRVVRLLEGTYEIDSSLLLYSKSGLIGAGPSSTIIKLTDGANTTALKTWNFTALYGTSAWNTTTDAVPYGFQIRNLMIDGNNGNINEGGTGSVSWGTNQTAGYGVALFGKSWHMSDVVIHDCYSHGMICDCGAYVSADYDSFDIERPEVYINGLFSGYNGGSGLRYEGPQDYIMDNLVMGRNGAADGALSGHTDGLSFSAAGQIGQIHEYGGGRGIHLAASVTVEKIYADFSDPGILVSGDDVSIGEIFTLHCGDHDEREQYEAADHNWTHLRVTGSNCQIGTALITADGDANEGIVTIDIRSSAENLQIGSMRILGDNDPGTALKLAAKNTRIGSVVISGYDGDGAFTSAGTFGTAGGIGIDVVDSEGLVLNASTVDCGTHMRWTEAVPTAWASADVNLQAEYGPRQTPLIGRPGRGVNIKAQAWDSADTVLPVLRAHNAGTATLVNGTTSIVVTHGLLGTPNKESITITPIEAWGSAGEWWVSATNAQNFTVTVDTDPGADVDFTWRASMEAFATVPEAGVPLNPHRWFRMWETANLSTTTTADPPARPSDTNNVRTVGNYHASAYDAVGVGSDDYTWDESNKWLEAPATDSVFVLEQCLGLGVTDYTIAGIFHTVANTEMIFFRNVSGDRIGVGTGLSAGNTAGKLFAVLCGDTFPSNVGTTDMSAATNNYFVVTIDGTAKTTSAWVNGSLEINAASWTGDIPSAGASTADREAYLGNSVGSSGTRGITGGMREFLLYHRQITSDEITALNAYLAAIAAL